jgi:aerobic-type carbon monoxide dehydrogenase small subunit (CoxS/CutS family)
MFEKVKELIGKLKPQNEKSVRLLEEAKAELREMVDVCVIRDVPSCGFCDLIAHKVRIETLETINDHLRSQLKSQLKSLICTGCEENERLKEERDQLRADMDFIRERVCSAFRGL